MIKAVNNIVLLDRINKPKGAIKDPFERESRWYKVKSCGPGVYGAKGVLITSDIEKDETVYVAAHGVKPFSPLDGGDSFFGASILDIMAKFENNILHPYGNLIVIEPIKDESKIKLPDSVFNHDFYAKVIYVGPGLKNENNEYIPVNTKPGDTVLYIPFEAQKIDMQPLGIDKKYLAISENHLIGIIE